MADIAGNFLDAMGIVSDSALQKQKYDMTIKATVLKTNVEDKATKYSCKYEGTTFTATGTAGEYEVDDIVYVVVPQSNWGMEKYIVFKVEKDLGESLDPFENFLNVNGGHADKYFPDRVQFIANYYQHDPGKASVCNYPKANEETEYKLFDLSVQDEPFTRMGIKMHFSTNHIVKWNCCEGNYGLYIKIYQQGAEDEARIFSLDTADMLGNVYTAEGWYEYKKVFDINDIKIDEKTCIKFYLMENGNFGGFDENMVMHHKLHTYTDPEHPDVTLIDEPPYEHTDDIIVAKNLNIYFGYAASDFYDGQIQLICNSDMNYDPSWVKDASKKKDLKKKLKWYIYEKEKGYLIRKKIPVVSDRDNYVKVYYSKGDSGDFKQIAKIRTPNTSCTVTITDVAEEKLVYMIKYWKKNLTFEDSNSPYLHTDSNTITFYRLSAPEGEDVDLSTKMDKQNGTGSGSFSINRAVGSAIGINSVAMGTSCKAEGNSSVAVGESTQAQGDGSLAEGHHTIAEGMFSHAEGYITIAGHCGHAEGQETHAYIYDHAEGGSTTAGGIYSHAEGYESKTYGNSSHAEGKNTSSGGEGTHAEGCGTTAGISNPYETGYGYDKGAHAEGYNTIANSWGSHAEGDSTSAIDGYATHAEGRGTIAGECQAHAEGQYTKAQGVSAHAEGTETEAQGDCSHTEGFNTKTMNKASGAHAEGVGTLARGHSCHAEGLDTVAQGCAQHVFGQRNEPLPSYLDLEHVYVGTEQPNSSTGYVEVVGGGQNYKETSSSSVTIVRKNIRTLDWAGNETLVGDLRVGGNIYTNNIYTNNGYTSIDTLISYKANKTEVMNNVNPTGSGTFFMNRRLGTDQGLYSTILGYNNGAFGNYAQSDGQFTLGYGRCLHVSGQFNKVDLNFPDYDSQETYNEYDCVFHNLIPYYCNTTISTPEEWNSEHWSYYNPSEQKTYLEIVGNGTADNARSNARTLDWSGNEWLAGNLTLGNSIIGGGNIILHYKDSNNTVHHIDVGATLVNLGYIPYTPPQP